MLLEIFILILIYFPVNLSRILISTFSNKKTVIFNFLLHFFFRPATFLV